MDSEFDRLHKKMNFTLEACCDTKGDNGHAGLRFYSPQDSLLNHDVSGQTIFMNPPWSKAKLFMDHVRQCHASDPKNTKALLVLPKWAAFNDITKDLTLYEEKPARQQLFTRSPESDGTAREPVTPAPWPLCYWLLDHRVPPVSQISEKKGKCDSPGSTNGIQEDQAMKAAEQFFPPTASCSAILDPDQPEPLMKLPIVVNNTEMDALLDTAATMSFVSENFVKTHSLTSRRAEKLAVRVANGSRINSTRVVHLDAVRIGQKLYDNLSFRVLPHLKAADLVLGLPTLKQLGIMIHPAECSVTIKEEKIPCHLEERRVECSLITPAKLNSILAKQQRCKSKQIAEFFLATLTDTNTGDEIDDIDTDFGSKFTNELKACVKEFSDITKPFTGLPPKRPGFDHHIEFTEEPKRQRRNRLSAPQYEELVRQCKEYFQQGRVRVSNSPYAAPIILVKKPDGSMRLCIDYRGANSCTVRDCYPLPRIDDLLDRLRDAKVMTHLDLQQGYHQIRMADDESIKRTAFQGVTPSGAPCLLEFLVMSFGLSNAPATFSRLMNHILEPYINKFVLVYLDDICVYSDSEEDHLRHLAIVLRVLRENNLHIKLTKCTWGRRESEYLGVIAGNGFLRCSPAKLDAVRTWPTPKTQKDVKSFVQFCSFYRKFVHHFADCSAVLTDMCRKNMPQTIQWTDAAQVAFETLKARLTSAPLLLIPKVGRAAEFVVVTDASNVGMGAVLLQEGPTGELHPCAYWARKLNDAQRRYSTYDKEALAAITAVTEEWRVYLDGCKRFTSVTDHATLVHLLKQPCSSLSDRQARWVEKIQPFASHMEFLYRKGIANESDPLSRRADFHTIWGEPDVVPQSAHVDEAELLALNVDDVIVESEFKSRLITAYNNTPYFHKANEHKWKGDKIHRGDDGVFRYFGRVVIPRPARELRQALLSEYHDSPAGGCHSSWKRTLAKLMARFWWRQISADVQKFCRECVICNRAKPDRRGPAPLDTLPLPQFPWEIVGVDFVTSLPKCGKNGHNSIMIVCCHLTKMAHFIPCTDKITAEESADLFLHHVFRLHGCPRVLVSDRDPRFVSEFWRSLWCKLGTKLNMSTARRPQTDGLTERINEAMQCLLRCYCAETGFDWESHLAMVEFAFNSQMSESGKQSPFEALYGYKPAVPVDGLFPSWEGVPSGAAARLQQIQDTQLLVRETLKLNKQRLEESTSTRQHVEFRPGDLVYLSTKGLRIVSQACKKLKDRRLGPYRVEAKIGLKSYRLHLPPGMRLHNVFHVDLLSQAPSSTPLRLQPPEVNEDDREYEVESIQDVKIDRFRGSKAYHLQFLVKYINDGLDYPEWSLLDPLDDEDGRVVPLDNFLKTDRWAEFKRSPQYLTWAKKHKALAKHLET